MDFLCTWLVIRILPKTYQFGIWKQQIKQRPFFHLSPLSDFNSTYSLFFSNQIAIHKNSDSISLQPQSNFCFWPPLHLAETEKRRTETSINSLRPQIPPVEWARERKKCARPTPDTQQNIERIVGPFVWSNVHFVCEIWNGSFFGSLPAQQTAPARRRKHWEMTFKNVFGFQERMRRAFIQPFTVIWAISPRKPFKLGRNKSGDQKGQNSKQQLKKKKKKISLFLYVLLPFSLHLCLNENADQLKTTPVVSCMSCYDQSARNSQKPREKGKFVSPFPPPS